MKGLSQDGNSELFRLSQMGVEVAQNFPKPIVLLIALGYVFVLDATGQDVENGCHPPSDDGSGIGIGDQIFLMNGMDGLNDELALAFGGNDVAGHFVVIGENVGDTVKPSLIIREAGLL